MSNLTNWRRHAPYHRRGRYPVRYGRDPGLLSTTKGKVVLALAALGAGGAALFFSKKTSAASSPAPTVPATPNPSNPTPATPAAPPVSTSADLAQVATHDPPPAGDLNVFDAPNGNRISGAEKGSLVSVISNDGTWAQVTTHNTEGRYVDVTGFVHAKFLTAPGAQAIGQTAVAQTQDALSALKGAFGF